MTSYIATELTERILTVTFQHPKIQNPMNRAMKREIIGLCARVAQDDAIGGVVFYGGAGRSFGAGGDFNEVAALTAAADVDAWIDLFTEMYVAVLSLEKPTVAALDGHVIGMGFQFALCCDLRLATPATNMVMSELQGGVACTFGAFMLRHMLGTAAMIDIAYTCRALDVAWAREARMLSEIAPPEQVLARACDTARRLAAYPALPFGLTKRAVNAPFIEGLRAVVPLSKQVHRAGFAAGAGTPHFERILKRSAPPRSA
jgi:enoyl-CoA hydratase/carnithine racemase